MATTAAGATPAQIENPNPFADAEAWQARIDGAADADGFDFASYAARCRENARPVAIVAVDPTEAPARVAGIVGAPTDPRRWLDLAILSALAERATLRLEAGDTLAWALTLDAGRDRLLEALRAAGALPVPVDRQDRERQRDRVGKARTRLLRSGALERVGTMPDHYRDGRRLSGAVVVRIRAAVIDAEGSPLDVLSELPRWHVAAPRSTNSDTEPGRPHAGRDRRAEAALSSVLGAKCGTRNATGYRLAGMLRTIGLPRAEAMPYMRRYVSGVSQRGHAYTWREAEASLRSAYRPARREPGEPDRLTRMLAEERLMPINELEPLEAFGGLSLQQVVSKALAEVNVENWNALDDLDRRVLSHLRRWRIVGEPASTDTRRNVATAIEAPMMATVRSLHRLETRGYVERRRGVYRITDAAPIEAAIRPTAAPF